jgi:hypothetical protein
VQGVEFFRIFAHSTPDRESDRMDESMNRVGAADALGVLRTFSELPVAAA